MHLRVYCFFYFHLLNEKTVFGANQSLLEVLSYYASHAEPYKFEDVTERIEPVCAG